jgi:hypothetical protein
VRPQRHHDGLPRDALSGLDAVTGGPDMRRAGAQVIVDDDAAGLADADAAPRTNAESGRTPCASMPGHGGVTPEAPVPMSSSS